MDSTEERRKLGNVVVTAKAHFNFAIPFVLLFGAGVGTVVYMFINFAAIVSENAEAMPPAVLAQMNLARNDFLTISMFGVVIMGFFCAVLWLFSAHRIFGPMIQINRKLDSLLDGKYDQKITLRKFDEFKPLADKLNDLGEKLSLRK